MLVAGGGATNAVCLHRARDAGLGGFEFASAIPGTAGGGVRMNAGRLRERLARGRSSTRSSSTPAARAPLTADELDLSYRHSGLAPGEVVAQVRFQLEPRPVEEIKATVAELLAQRKATQPTTKRTFGSVFKNPPGERGAGRADRGVRAEGPPDRRRRDLRAPRELHRERGRCDVGRRARADGRGAAARVRRVRRRARARGALPRPARAAAAVGERPGAANRGAWPRPGERPRAPRLCPRGARSRRSPATCRRSARSRSASGCSRSPSGAYALARQTSMFALRDVKVAGGSPELQAAGSRGARAGARPQPRRDPGDRGRGAARRGARRARGAASTATSRTRCALVVTPERPVLLLRRGKEGWVVSARGRVLRKVENTRLSSLPRVWIAGRTPRSRSTSCSRPRAERPRRPRSRRSPARSSRRASGPCGRPTRS